MSTAPLLIESIIQRKGGTKIKLGTTAYHFTPDDKGRHVAAVEDPDHIGRLLGIPEGYRIPREADADKPAVSGAALGASGAKVESATVKDLTITKDQGKAAQLPPKAEGSEPASGQTDPKPAPAGATDLADMDIDQLRAAHKDEIGREAHPQAKEETLRAKIQAQRDEASGAA